MSENNQHHEQHRKNENQAQQQNYQPVQTYHSQRKNNQNVSLLLKSQNIKRSAYHFNSEFEQQDEQEQRERQQQQPIYASEKSFSQKRYEKQDQTKQLQFGNLSKPSQKPIEDNNQHQLYESISSDRSNEDKLAIQRQSEQDNHSKNSLSSKNVLNSKKISQNIHKHQINYSDQTVSNQNQHQQKHENNSRSLHEPNLLSQKQHSTGEERHATFRLENSQAGSDPNQSQLLSFEPNLKSVKASSERRSSVMCSYPQLDESMQQKKSNQSKKHITGIRSNSRKQISIKKDDQQMDFQESINYLKSHKNYPKSPKNYTLTLKKMTSEDPSTKRRDSLNQLDRKQTDESFSNPDEKLGPRESVLASRTRSKRGEDTNRNQSPNMFYISVSGQEMYPSLDLRKNAKQLGMKQEKSINLRKEQISENKCRDQIARKNNSKLKVSMSTDDPRKPSKIKIAQYHTEYFLKIETQIFSIQVEFPSKQKQIKLKKSNQSQEHYSNLSEQNYEIQRRFSDFLFLYEAITTNHLGYIIYPFPMKTLESFVKIKLQSLIGTTSPEGTENTEAQKMQLIQKRIGDLQRFVNFLLSHQELKYSEELAIFLCRDTEIYQKSRERLQKYIQEYKQLQTSSNIIEEGKKNIKKAVETGVEMVLKWWGSSGDKKDLNKKIQKINLSKQISIDSIHEEDNQFGRYSQILTICFAKFSLLEKSLLKLLQTHQKLISFNDIDTEFDYLVKLCAKISSGKQYSKVLTQLIEIELIKDIEMGRKWLQQTREQLNKREQLKQLINALKESVYSNDQSSKISKLERRLERFEKNFRFGFKGLIKDCEEIFERSRKKFMEQWQSHSSNMKKIWK